MGSCTIVVDLIVDIGFDLNRPPYLQLYNFKEQLQLDTTYYININNIVCLYHLVLLLAGELDDRDRYVKLLVFFLLLVRFKNMLPLVFVCLLCT